MKRAKLERRLARVQAELDSVARELGELYAVRVRVAIIGDDGQPALILDDDLAGILRRDYSGGTLAGVAARTPNVYIGSRRLV